jgi:hypothetical protein
VSWSKATIIPFKNKTSQLKTYDKLNKKFNTDEET